MQGPLILAKIEVDITNAELPPIHQIRLGLALTFFVFYYEILISIKEAVDHSGLGAVILMKMKFSHGMKCNYFEEQLYRHLPTLLADFNRGLLFVASSMMLLMMITWL